VAATFASTSPSLTFNEIVRFVQLGGKYHYPNTVYNYDTKDGKKPSGNVREFSFEDVRAFTSI
jgi:hypothetical protein